MNEKVKRVELLAPAGNLEGFRGAVAAGADAVYLGGPAYGARAYAQNFTEEELTRAIQEAHVCGVRVYMTTNVLTRQEELPALLDLVSRMDAAGLDGVIVQDLGVLQALRERCPHLLLHASTQMSVASSESVTFLKRLGVSRVVPARELSLEEMRQILAEEEIEIEAFIHGAMCYAYSGRCLMSSFLGGRSGNRGRCAGTCRLPYTILGPDGTPSGKDGECYPLSMRDMCVLSILPELIDAGIASFKIEGRMKRPEYAAGTTAIYRRYIDRYYAWTANGRPGKWTVDDADLADLLQLYIRAELSTGYYHQHNGRNMLTIGKGGYNGASEEQLEQIRQTYLMDRKRMPATGYAYVYAGQPAIFTVSVTSPWSGELLSASAEGPVADAAKARPVTTADLEQRLSKTGDTDYMLTELTVDSDEQSFLPVGQINALRRRAFDALQEAQLVEYGRMRERIQHDEGIATGVRRQPARDDLCLQPADHELWALVMTREQYDAAHAAVLAGELQTILLDGPLLDTCYEQEWENTLSLSAILAAGGRVLTALPQIMRSGDRKDLNLLYNNCYEKVTGFFVRSAEEIEFLQKKDYDGTVVVGSSVYHWNRSAESVVLENAAAAVLPLELSGRELLETFRESLSREVLPVYGRVPMMISANCVRQTAGLCRHREEGFYGLLDRKRAVFPVRTDCRHCQNVIYNSVPLSLHRYAGDALHQNVGARLCMFTTENGQEAGDILHGYYLLGEDSSSQEGLALMTQALPSGHTSGHYGRGAL